MASEWKITKGIIPDKYNKFTENDVIELWKRIKIMTGLIFLDEKYRNDCKNFSDFVWENNIGCCLKDSFIEIAKIYNTNTPNQTLWKRINTFLKFAIKEEYKGYRYYLYPQSVLKHISDNGETITIKKGTILERTNEPQPFWIFFYAEGVNQITQFEFNIDTKNQKISYFEEKESIQNSSVWGKKPKFVTFKYQATKDLKIKDYRRFGNKWNFFIFRYDNLGDFSNNEVKSGSDYDLDNRNTPSIEKINAVKNDGYCGVLGSERSIHEVVLFDKEGIELIQKTTYEKIKKKPVIDTILF